MKTAIIVDSTAYLSDELASLDNVFQVMLTVNFSDGTSIIDTSNLQEQREYYHRLMSESQLPTTSQPTPGEYFDLMDRLCQEGYDTVYCIHLSSAISGTYQTARMVASEYEDRMTIYCIDSKASAVIMENLVIQLLKMLENELASDVIANKLQWIVEQSRAYLMVEDLSNLVKGGRISSTNALLGGILKVRPLLTFNERGEIVLFEKIRTNKKVYKRWHELIEESLLTYPNGIYVAFTHADDLEAIEEVMRQTQEMFPQVTYGLSSFGPVVGTHTGKGCKAMGIIPAVI